MSNMVVEKHKVKFGLLTIATWLISLFGLVQTIAVAQALPFPIPDNSNYSWWWPMTAAISVVVVFATTILMLAVWIAMLKKEPTF